jgi:peroxiredoxin
MDTEEALKIVRRVKPDFEIMVDRGGKLVDLLGIRHKNANPIKGQDLPRSASFLFTRDGRLIWHTLAQNYRVRPGPNEILAAARAKM